jgi:hypothetical protein
VAPAVAPGAEPPPQADTIAQLANIWASKVILGTMELLFKTVAYHI